MRPAGGLRFEPYQVTLTGSLLLSSMIHAPTLQKYRAGWHSIQHRRPADR